LQSIWASTVYNISFAHPTIPREGVRLSGLTRRIKEKLCLVVYCSPDELKKAINQGIATYNSIPPRVTRKCIARRRVCGEKGGYLTEKKREKTIDLGTQKEIQS
jgi:hypothetical protein